MGDLNLRTTTVVNLDLGIGREVPLKTTIQEMNPGQKAFTRVLALITLRQIIPKIAARFVLEMNLLPRNGNPKYTTRLLNLALLHQRQFIIIHIIITPLHYLLYFLLCLLLYIL